MVSHDEDDPSASGLRRTLDARSLRALAHPLRMNLLELLSLDGPATATGLSGRVGESTGTVSWHLRLLAEHGFIEEDIDRGTRRERWWRAVKGREILRAEDFVDAPELLKSFGVYTRERVSQAFRRIIDSLAEDWDRPWLTAATMSDWVNVRMTPAQLVSLNQELYEVVERHRMAASADPGPDAEHVIVQIQSFPRKGHEAE